MNWTHPTRTVEKRIAPAMRRLYDRGEVNETLAPPDEGFHPLIEGTAAALFVFDADKVLYINPACRQLTGKSARDILGQPFIDLVHPRARRAIQNKLQKGAVARHQVEIQQATGETVWADLQFRPVFFRGAMAMLATAFDISGFKLADTDRRDREVQLKLVQRAGRTVSWEWRVHEDVLLISGLPKEILDSAAPILATSSRALFESVHAEDLVVLKQRIRNSLSNGDPLFVEVRLRAPEGDTHWLVLRAQPISSPTAGGTHLVGVATDISDRRRAEEALFHEQEETLAVLASIADGVIQTDVDATVRELSSTAQRLLGLKEEEAEGRPLGEILHLVDPSSRERFSDPVAAIESANGTENPASDFLLLHPDGTEIPIRVHGAILHDADGDPTGRVFVLKDLLAREAADRSVVYLATHDHLTDLVNRTEFERQLARSLSSASDGNQQHTLLYLDLDDFKQFNDTFGHPAGDKMLKQFASFLKTRFRETDTLGRLGGDKFAVLLEECPAVRARGITEKLFKDLGNFRLAWNKTSVPASVSVGVVVLDSESPEVPEILSSAETACYMAKQAGGNRYNEFEPAEVAADERQSHLQTLQNVQEALREDGFELYAQLIQPILAVDSAPWMYEVLLRMRDGNGGLVLPGNFIPLAERHRLAASIDQWVVRKTLIAISDRIRDFGPEETLIAVNLSGQSVSDERFLEFVLQELSYRSIPTERLCFEITETATVSDFDRAQRFISVLKGRGCRFVLDDFGSGLSSFSYLRSFPVDFIKIDGQFVRGIAKDPIQRALVESINHVGHVMQMKTIAEWVEDDEILALTRLMNVDYVQGFGIARPQPLSSILESSRVPAHES